MNSKLFFVHSLILCLLLSGCVKWQGAMGMDANLREAVFNSVDTLIQNSETPLSPKTAFLVASLVNINSLKQSSTFGRTIAEYINSRLVWQGYSTSEIKLRQTLFIEEESGEFLLSRNINELSLKHNAQVVVVGSYSIGKYIVYINLRLVDAVSNKVLSASEFEVPLGVEARTLLQNDRLF